MYGFWLRFGPLPVWYFLQIALLRRRGFLIPLHLTSYCCCMYIQLLVK